MIDYAIILIALPATIYASYTDVKTREVPNWLSFGLIFIMLGLRGLEYLLYGNWGTLLLCLASGGLFTALGFLMFYGAQWGGADVKLLIAFGFGFGGFAQTTSAFWPFSATFLMNFLIIAVIYSILYALYEAFKNQKVLREFRASVNRFDLAGCFFVCMLAIALSFYEPLFFWLALAPPLWILSKFLKIVEGRSMLKSVRFDEIVEFDIPVKDIIVNGEKIVSSKDPNGVSPEQIKRIKELAKSGKLPKRINVKWGVPLIPVFPIAITASVLIIVI